MSFAELGCVDCANSICRDCDPDAQPADGFWKEQMTTPDIAGLCERLRHKALMRSFCDTLEPVNPDGHEAAATIERQAAELANCRQHWSSEFKKLSAESKALAEEQAAEIERLRALLMLARPFVADDTEATCDLADRIDAALTGED